jgi:hypothetical protein
MPRCPECEADAYQVDWNWNRRDGFPADVEELLVCENEHQVAVTYRAVEKETYNLDEDELGGDA